MSGRLSYLERAEDCERRAATAGSVAGPALLEVAKNWRHLDVTASQIARLSEDLRQGALRKGARG